MFACGVLTEVIEALSLLMCAVVGSKSLTLGEHIDAIIHEDYNKPPSDKEREMTSASKLSILGMLLYTEWSINLQLMHCVASFVFLDV